MFCREQAARFQEHHEAFGDAGATVIAIGNGTAPMATDFVDQFGIRFTVFTDPSRESFRLAGMRRRFGIGLRTFAAAFRALRRGHFQGRTKGDPWQQGGVLAFDTDGRVLFEHVDAGAGLHADVADVLEAVRAG